MHIKSNVNCKPHPALANAPLRPTQASRTSAQIVVTALMRQQTTSTSHFSHSMGQVWHLDAGALCSINSLSLNRRRRGLLFPKHSFCSTVLLHRHRCLDLRRVQRLLQVQKCVMKIICLMKQDALRFWWRVAMACTRERIESFSRRIMSTRSTVAIPSGCPVCTKTCCRA